MCVVMDAAPHHFMRLSAACSLERPPPLWKCDRLLTESQPALGWALRRGRQKLGQEFHSTEEVLQ